MSSQNHAQVLIVGGSVAGLALAKSFETVGIDYLVLEQWHEIAPDVGASIAIFPNGYRILDQLGLYEDIAMLNEGADAFKIIEMKNESGKVFSRIDDASKCFKARIGYEPFFVDRQMIIRILYESLKDKSKVLVSKCVDSVEQIPEGVKVETRDGEIFTGDILVGADGIHSTVRREMWRIAGAEQPDYISAREQQEVATEYCCIFGTSKPTEKFEDFSSQHVMGRDHSYLLASGPGHRIYWFLFKKLSKTARGLYEKVPRFTESERDSLAEEHANDHLGGALYFGDLYKRRTTATLQALPEVVFKQWHYRRIITIGDAAHKFNPISGQGGNSAIEDVAVLTNQLYSILNSGSKLTDQNIKEAFSTLRNIRHDRSRSIMGSSHLQQSLFAMDTLLSRLVARYIMPHSTKEQTLELLLTTFRPAARLDMISVPSRPHLDSWYDERPAKPLSARITKFARLIAYAAFAYLAYLAKQLMDPPINLQPHDQFRIKPKTFTGFEIPDLILNGIVQSFVYTCGWYDVGHSLQFLYLLLWLTPILMVWYIEASRYGNRGSLISLPAIYGVLMNFQSIGVVAPVYCLAFIWSTASQASTNGIHRHVSESIARALLPSLSLSYIIPTLLMFIPTLPNLAELIITWQFAAVGVSSLIIVLSKQSLRYSQESSTTAELKSYSRDATHLFQAYKAIFLFSAVYHVLIVGYALVSGNLLLSLSRLLLPVNNSSIKLIGDYGEEWFCFLKWDFALSSLAMSLLGLFTLLDLRGRGLISTKEIVLSSLLFLGAQVALGLGAALVGMWWWREKKMLGQYQKTALL